MVSAKHQVLAVIDEALNGPPPGFAYFSDRGEQAGLAALLRSIDAPSASRIVGKTSIAAHVHHLGFALDASARFIAGDMARVDWTASWTSNEVDETGWHQLIDHLTIGVDRLNEAIDSCFDESERTVGAALGAAAHLAYHLGAIRQKVVMIEDDGM